MNFVGFWWLIGIVLSLITFGPLNILYVVLYLGCFIVGGVAIIYEYCQKEVLNNTNYFSSPVASQTARLKSGIESIVKVQLNDEQENEDGSFTGSPEIDKQLRVCVDYLIRDYVKYWYNDLSDDQAFIKQFHILLQHCIKNISVRCQSIEWQPYLTTVLVDQFATHIRLFRKAKKDLKSLAEESEAQEIQSAVASVANGTPVKCNIDDIESREKLLEMYFDNEIAAENIARDLVACDTEKQIMYLSDLSEILLYVVMPVKDFHCKPLVYLLRETMVRGIFVPTFKLYSSPDYLNQYVSWLISDNCVTSEWFLTVLRHTQTVGELGAVRDKAEEEIERLTSKDAVGDDPIVKQQLRSMRYVLNICQRLIHQQRDGETIGYSYLDIENPNFAKTKLYNLPLNVVLRNNIALQIFIEYMQSVNGQAYLFFWLTVDGYRAAAEQQLNEVKVQQLKGTINGAPDMEMLRTIGHNIYEQYLSKHADPRVPLDAAVDKQLKKKLDSGIPSPYIFDDIQVKVFDIMQKNERFFPEFKTSSFYIRMLAELDLLQEPSLTSADTNESLLSGSSQEEPIAGEPEDDASTLTAEITQTGICSEHGKTYALYAIAVKRIYASGKEESWATFRRFREFHDLHCSLKENGTNLNNMRLPGKTFFKDLKEEFLEKRRAELNQYLNTLLDLPHPPKAMECLHMFLDAKAYQNNSQSFASKVDTLMRTSVKNVTNFVSQAPDNFIDGIQKASDKVSDGIQKISDKLPTTDKRDPIEKLNEQIEYNIGNNIPIGILLILMDEVFDLKRKNQWLRRQIVAAVQQLLRTLFGDRMNRKIIDYVESALSAEQVAQYIATFCDNFWPSGILAEEMPPRKEVMVMRSRVLTKAKMHGVIPDELRPIVGNETCRRGVVRLFDLMQYEELNTRFCCVLLEGITKKLFPINNFDDMFTKFHSLSPRLRVHKRKKMLATDRTKSMSSRSIARHSTLME